MNFFLGTCPKGRIWGSDDYFGKAFCEHQVRHPGYEDQPCGDNWGGGAGQREAKLLLLQRPARHRGLPRPHPPEVEESRTHPLEQEPGLISLTQPLTGLTNHWRPATYRRRAELLLQAPVTHPRLPGTRRLISHRFRHENHWRNWAIVYVKLFFIIDYYSFFIFYNIWPYYISRF